MSNKTLTYGLVAFLLIIVAILGWHNLIIKRQLEPEHPARKRAKLLYLAVIVIAFLTLMGFAALLLFGQMQQIALNELNSFLKTPNGKIVLEYITIIKGRMAGLV